MLDLSLFGYELMSTGLVQVGLNKRFPLTLQVLYNDGDEEELVLKNEILKFRKGTKVKIRIPFSVQALVLSSYSFGLFAVGD